MRKLNNYRVLGEAGDEGSEEGLPVADGLSEDDIADLIGSGVDEEIEEEVGEVAEGSLSEGENGGAEQAVQGQEEQQGQQQQEEEITQQGVVQGQEQPDQGSDPTTEQTVEQPPETPEVQAQNQEQAPEAQETDPAKDAEEVEKFMGDLRSKYQISDDDADLLVTKPEEVLPKLAANIHAQVMSQVLGAVSQAIPGLVEQVIGQRPQVVGQAVEVNRTREEHAQKFYDKYSKLRGHDEVVASAAKTVKANFPGESIEVQLEKTGQVAMAMLGLSMGEVEEQVEAPAEPFVPASPGASSGQVSKGNGSVWEEFI